jgi:hypothetical protein
MIWKCDDICAIEVQSYLCRIARGISFDHLTSTGGTLLRGIHSQTLLMISPDVGPPSPPRASRQPRRLASTLYYGHNAR